MWWRIRADLLLLALVALTLPGALVRGSDVPEREPQAPVAESNLQAELEPERRPRPVKPLAELGGERVHRDPLPLPATFVSVEGPRDIRERPGAGQTIGTMPAGSPWFNVPTHAWIFERTPNGRFGRVAVPYSASRNVGWMYIGDLRSHTTPYSVVVDISKRILQLKRFERTIETFPVGVGTPTAPTPPGRYFVTDLIPFDPGGPLGAFAFGLSGIQPNLPPGWYGGDQLAIHGTNDPASIPGAVSAGCIRVTNEVTDYLKPYLQLGTPVTFMP